jgi:hypothetical protein
MRTGAGRTVSRAVLLGETLLIAHFKPVWNLALDGFGNQIPAPAATAVSVRCGTSYCPAGQKGEKKKAQHSEVMAGWKQPSDTHAASLYEAVRFSDEADVRL